MIETILHSDKIFAYILRSNFNQEGISFFTPNDFEQQFNSFSVSSLLKKYGNVKLNCSILYALWNNFGRYMG